MRTLNLVVFVTFGLLQAAVAQQQTPLGDIPKFHEGYYNLWMANKVRKECPAIKLKLEFLIPVAQKDVDALKQAARDMGYSNQQIDAYIDSDAEKDRFGKRRTALFMKRGHKRNEDGYCAFGREEIARNSAIGVYLHARN